MPILWLDQEDTPMDLTIAGYRFYVIAASTAAGRRFLKLVQGAKDAIAYCDDTQMVEEIAHGALTHGLRVSLNDRELVLPPA